MEFPHVNVADISVSVSGRLPSQDVRLGRGTRTPWDVVSFVRRRRITWLGVVLRRDKRDAIKKIVLQYARVVLRHRRIDEMEAVDSVDDEPVQRR